MKYFRVYPWWLQLFLFSMMVLTMGSFGFFIVNVFLAKFSPYTFAQMVDITERSPALLINTSLIVQGVFNASLFLVPAFTFAYLTHPSPKEYLGLRPPGKKIQWLLALLVIFGAMPVLQYIQVLISHIDFGAKVKAEQAINDNMMNAYMNMPSLGAFIRAFIVMAIIPAFGEEFFFRGIFMRFAKKRSRNMIWPVIITAAVFSYSHTNIYGYASIFLAGILLAVIYNLTGSLWCSIIAHMFFNGFQVILSYLGNNNPAVRSFITNDNVPAYWAITGAVIFGISFYLLLKNKTPLPPNWADDFPPATSQQSEWDFMSKN